MNARTSRRGWRATLTGGFAALSIVAYDGSTRAQDDPGQVLFNNSCRTCHTVKEGDNRLGPTLAGVVGRKAGSLPDYAFSDSLKKSGVVWDEASLDRFIENPEAVAPGNAMKPYTGVSSPEDRAAIIAYLKSQPGGSTN